MWDRVEKELGRKGCSLQSVASLPSAGGEEGKQVKPPRILVCLHPRTLTHFPGEGVVWWYSGHAGILCSFPGVRDGDPM